MKNTIITTLSTALLTGSASAAVMAAVGNHTGTLGNAAGVLTADDGTFTGTANYTVTRTATTNTTDSTTAASTPNGGAHGGEYVLITSDLGDNNDSETFTLLVDTFAGDATGVGNIIISQHFSGNPWNGTASVMTISWTGGGTAQFNDNAYTATGQSIFTDTGRLAGDHKASGAFSSGDELHFQKLTGTQNGADEWTVVLPTGVDNVKVTISDSDATGAGPAFEYVSFQTTLVPEPSSTALLGLGGLALILRRRK